MRVIPPLTGASPVISEAMLTSTSVAETETQWLVGTTYAAGTIRRGVNGDYAHRLFESVQSSNTGHNPETDDGTWWIDAGPTNRWAMFDTLRNTGTTDASPITVTITPGQVIDSIAAFGLVADAISVDMKVGGVSLSGFPRSIDLNARNVGGWWEWLYKPFAYKAATAIIDLPAASTATVTVTFTRASGDVTVGGLMLGQSIYLGVSLQDAENDALNFSTIERDDFGTAILVPRRTVPKVNITTRLIKSGVNAAIVARTSLNAIPAVWLGLDDPNDGGFFEPVLIVGIYKRFTVTMDQPNHAIVTLELEEV